jgi:hypothetical protein
MVTKQWMHSLRTAAAGLILAVGACAPVDPEPAAGGDCSAALHSMVDSFLDAYNNGPASAAADHFAALPAFEWYSDGERIGPAAYDRSTLEAHFQAQLTAGDTLRRDSVLSSGYEPERDIVHFNGAFVRGSVDYLMKGAFSCASERFIVWSMGENTHPERPRGPFPSYRLPTAPDESESPQAVQQRYGPLVGSG